MSNLANNLSSLEAFRKTPFRKRQSISRQYALCRRVAEKGNCSSQMASQVLNERATSARVEAIWNVVLAELAAELAAQDAA